MENPRLVLGLKVRNLRRERRRTLKELAAAAGLSISYLSEIEKGKKYPKPERLVALAAALGIPYDELVSLKVDEALGPLKEAVDSPLLREFPFDLFGVEPEDLVALMSAHPTRGGALLKALLEMGQSYDLHVEHFLLAALRAYQELNANYFEELEQRAAAFRERRGWSGAQPLDPEALSALLVGEHGYELDFERLPGDADLAGFRSVLVGGPLPRLYVNPRLLPSQRAFVLAREVGYLELELEERAMSSSWLEVESFDQVFNNFQASYFAGALMIDREELRADLERIFAARRWSDASMLRLLDRYDVTPETLLTRLTQIAPRFFGLGELFFLRFSTVAGSGDFRLTKWLNTSRVPIPYALGLGEHYCRRWSVLRLLAGGAKSTDPRRVEVAAQRSAFVDRDGEFFVVTMARPLALRSGVLSGVSVGFAAGAAFRRVATFHDDPAVPRVEVNLTCERCRLSAAACADRVAPPVLWERQRDQERKAAALERLTGERRGPAPR